MIRIVCTSCQKPLSLDETKLPMKEVSFPCPVCKAKLSVDKRTLGTEEAVEQAEEEDGFAAKALLVGTDHPALRQAAKLIGFLPVHYATAAEARDFFMQEFPQVVMIHPPQMTAPPLEAMNPIIALTPSDRRKAFFILFADNLRTLDGNAAFLYGVNLVVAPKDLAAFPQIYRDAHAHHERLYAPMHSVLKQMHA
ncbi:MAG TPA: hypothetical protein VGR02_22290 [Thermoanaerobaculia bacterium]|jgi:hypothetical protein|nr:hypothetical protein [Thermoanaerobaculia bacterium]